MYQFWEFSVYQHDDNHESFVYIRPYKKMNNNFFLKTTSMNESKLYMNGDWMVS